MELMSECPMECRPRYQVFWPLIGQVRKNLDRFFVLTNHWPEMQTQKWQRVDLLLTWTILSSF